MAIDLLSPANLKALAYGAMNVVSASGIVFANKAVFQTYGFHFTYALTWVHTVFTLVGMRVFASCGMFGVKAIPQRRLVPLAAAYVAYIVLCNLSLKVNTVGFYQVRVPREGPSELRVGRPCSARAAAALGLHARVGLARTLSSHLSIARQGADGAHIDHSSLAAPEPLKHRLHGLLIPAPLSPVRPPFPRS